MAPDEAKEKWSKLFEDAVKFCSHGPNCKNGASCTVGRRVEYKHILTGAVLGMLAGFAQLYLVFM